jgi:hypothetical protein
MDPEPVAPNLAAPPLKRAPSPRQRAWRAVLLSGVVCPGAGQFYNRHWWKGMLMIAAVLAILGILVFQIAQEVVRRVIEDPSLIGPLGVLTLTNDIERQNGGLFLGLTLALLVVWGVSIWDAWRGALRA